MDKDQKKLMRRFTILWFVSLGLILLVIFLATQQNQREVERYVDKRIENATLSQPIPQVPEPIPGQNGKDGVTTTIEKQHIIHETITLPGPVGLPGRDGAPGKDGVDGKDGRQLLIQINPITKDLETKYADDSFWQVLIPCKQLLTKCGEQNGTVTE